MTEHNRIYYTIPNDGNNHPIIPPFTAKGMEIINYSGHALTITTDAGFVYLIPAGGFLQTSVVESHVYNFKLAASDQTGSIAAWFYNRALPLRAGQINSGSGGGGSSVTITGPLDSATTETANTTPRVVLYFLDSGGTVQELISSAQAQGSAVDVIPAIGSMIQRASDGKVTILGSVGAQASQTLGVGQGLGATNFNASSAVQSTVAAILAIARPTRIGVIITNRDSAITVYIGGSGVTSVGANGVQILPGQSRVVTAVGAIYCVSASGTPTVDFWDEYY